jgi:hypothetical protein
VPDFRDIDFNLAGKPEFVRVTSVHKTLKALEALTNSNGGGALQTMKAKSLKDSFKQRWKRRKKDNLKAFLDSASTKKTQADTKKPQKSRSGTGSDSLSPRRLSICTLESVEKKVERRMSAGALVGVLPTELPTRMAQSRPSSLTPSVLGNGTTQAWCHDQPGGGDAGVERRISMTATRPAPVGKTMSYAKAPLMTKTNTALADWMTDHTAKPRPIEQDLGRDQMLRLANTGDRLLHYTGTHDDEKGRAPGVYVSTRPLSCLDDASFQATLVNASHPMTSHAVIGFYIDNSSVRRVDADKYELLGLAEKSVGFDCLAGSLSWTLNCKYNELTELETIGEGEMVSAQARPRPDGSCEVTFSKSRPTEMPTVLGKVQVGFISPSELFPVVEFRLSQEASRSSKGFSPKLS